MTCSVIHSTRRKNSRIRREIAILLMLLGLSYVTAGAQTPVWAKFEQSFASSKEYENPLYEVKTFSVSFVSPSGRLTKVNGFWDGASTWKVRFCPDEQGKWSYTAFCSDTTNTGLHRAKGTFDCTENNSRHAIYRKGSITRPKGSYHLTYADGTPFFWAACTAWNGALKSTDEEWDTYLAHRSAHQYTAIQLVATQWRGCESNSLGQVAFEGSGRIRINPDFFRHMDKKIDKVNAYGLVAAPVLLWALPVAQGRELSPGYYLPDEEAILLARYMVARYGGNQVVWILGGDGKYVDEFEQRWKNIGRGVFGEAHPGVVSLHPMGRSWIGEAYAGEDWLDIVGYQSGHDNTPKSVTGITQGHLAQKWHTLPAKPFINMEPVYEEVNARATDADVRNASYWSLFSAPVSGITYGANGIWPWLREGESILNHGNFGRPDTHRWHESIHLPGSLQIGYLSQFMQQQPWWQLKPAQELLVEQPGEREYKHFISVLKTDDHGRIMAYLPVKVTVKLYNARRSAYRGEWYNPATNTYTKAAIRNENGVIEATPAAADDAILVLTRTEAAPKKRISSK